MRTIRPFLALLTLLGSLALHAPSASAAATTYQLKWPAPYPNMLQANSSYPISWSKSPNTAPDLARAVSGGSACTVKRTTTSFGVRYSVERGKVSNNRATQTCPVTIQGGTNASWFPSPITIIHEYIAVNYEPIKFIEFPWGQSGWCVSKCSFQAGTIRSIIRDRVSGFCTEFWIGMDESGKSGGYAAPTPCPHKITLTLKKSYAAGKTHTIEARSNLGLDVTMTTSTSKRCVVKDTNEPKSHKVRGIAKGTCKLTASRAGSTQWQEWFGKRVYMYPSASASGSTKITGVCKADCDTDLQDQTITSSLPPSAPEFSTLQAGLKASSNLPVTVEVLTENRCMYDDTTGEVVLQQFLLSTDPADPNLQNKCLLRVTQPGDNYWAAEEAQFEVGIGCSEVTCPPVITPPPVAADDSAPFAYSDNGSYTAETRGNDKVIVPETFSAVKDQPAAGTVTINPSTGSFEFKPRSGYFVGTTSFTYFLFDGNGETSNTATVSITVTPPTPPPPPTAPSTAVTIRAGKWMRLNTTETISAVASGSCGSTALTNGICGSHPDAGGIVGAYNRFSKVELTAFELTAPAGYPSNRWSIVENPATGTPSSVFSTGASAKLRFQQATAAGTSFTVKLGFKLTWQSVQWTRFNGVLVETIVAEGATLAGTQSSFGVIGSTN